ncbi:MAG: V-type ATP synthase subunit B, partial [Gammaproteobacteria bacterium]
GRDLDRQGVYPPIQVLPSLSRLMDFGIGKGFTHPDHPALAQQLFAAYAKAIRVRVLESVMGEEGLTVIDRNYLTFAAEFEQRLVRQDTGRTLEESMDIGWSVLRSLPASELTRLKATQIEKYIEGDERA